MRCAPPSAEPLEPRVLCKAPTHNFGALTGYTAPNADWTYDYNYSLKADTIGSDSGSGQTTIRARRSGAGANRKFTLTSTSNTGAGQSIHVFQGDAQGLNVVKLQTDAGNSRITINLAGTRLAPTSLTLGKTYSDSGTYTGSFAGAVSGASVKGSLAGQATATTRLSNVEAVTTPAGTFDTAVKGTQTVALTGALRITIGDQSATGTLTATFATTFWAVKNVGLVRSKESLTITLRVGGASAVITLTGNSRLVSSTLLDPPAAVRRTPLFSAAPLLSPC